MDEKRLLPEREYRAWDQDLVRLREETHQAMLRFNTTGDKQVLKELFRQPLEDVSIAPPLHCNYGGDYIRFGHRVFINANCTFQPAGGVEIGDDVYIGSDVKFYTTIHPTDPEERTTGKASVRPSRLARKFGLAELRSYFRAWKSAKVRPSGPEVSLHAAFLHVAWQWGIRAG